ncbi:MAG TPA: FliM/FliN family flagellar motor C-terminal domain-containing protein [Phenylobacterium sp.]
MTDRARPWLPIGVADRPILRTKLATVVEAWADSWFADAKPSMLEFETREGAQAGDHPPESIVYRSVLSASVTERALLRLLGCVMDLDPASGSVERGDLWVLRPFASQMIGDLLQRLEIGLGLEAEAGSTMAELPSRVPTRVVGFGVGLGQDVLVSVLAPFELVLPMCEASLPPPRAAIAPLAPRLHALRSQQVPLEASLGRIELLLGELRTISPGDVLVLGRRLRDPVDITLAGSGTMVASGKLGEKQGRRALTLRDGSVREVDERTV